MTAKLKPPKKYKKNKKLVELNNKVEKRLLDFWKVGKLPSGGPNQLTIQQTSILYKLMAVRNLYNLEALAVENSRQILFLEDLISQWQIAQTQIVEKYTEQLNISEKKFEDERKIRNEVVRTYNNFVHFGQFADPEDIKKWNKDLPEGLRGSHQKYEIKTKLMESGKTSTSIKEKKKDKPNE